MLLHGLGRFQFAWSRFQFRHDAARPLVTSVDLPTVAALLEHSRVDTVRIYTQPVGAALERRTCSTGEALR